MEYKFNARILESFAYMWEYSDEENPGAADELENGFLKMVQGERPGLFEKAPEAAYSELQFFTQNATAFNSRELFDTIQAFYSDNYKAAANYVCATLVSVVPRAGLVYRGETVNGERYSVKFESGGFIGDRFVLPYLADRDLKYDAFEAKILWRLCLLCLPEMRECFYRVFRFEKKTETVTGFEDVRFFPSPDLYIEVQIVISALIAYLKNKNLDYIFSHGSR